MANPADGLKQVAKELQEKFDEAGMKKVDEFVDTLEGIKEKAEAGPGAIMDEVQKKFNDFKGNLEKAINDPSSLVPSGGPAAMLATWYGNSVAGKLGALKDEVDKLIEQILSLGKQIAEPMKKLGEVLGSAMKELEKTLKKLSKLPAEVGKMAKEIDSPDDIAKIEVGPMKDCLKVDGIDAPLKSLGSLADFDGIIAMVKDGLQTIMDFAQSSAEQIKAAFSVPYPCCCCTTVALSNAPPAFNDMMGMVENLKKLDLSPLIDMLTNTAQTMSGIDVALIKAPVDKFAASAGASVDKLEKTVAAAKLSSDPAGAMKAMNPFG